MSGATFHDEFGSSQSQAEFVRRGTDRPGGTSPFLGMALGIVLSLPLWGLFGWGCYAVF